MEFLLLPLSFGRLGEICLRAEPERALQSLSFGTFYV